MELTAAQISRYDRDGFLVIEDLFDAACPTIVTA